jgi:hypothetical protein
MEKKETGGLWEWKSTNDGIEFLKEVQDLLEKNEPENSMLLAIAIRTANGGYRNTEQAKYFWIKSGETVFCAMMSHNMAPLLTTKNFFGDGQAVKDLFDFLGKCKQIDVIERVFAPLDVLDIFMPLINASRAEENKLEVLRNQKVFFLEKVNQKILESKGEGIKYIGN